MLFVDRRIGSKDLLAPLKASGLDAHLVELDYGDVAFSGRGAQGASVDIGVELKTLNDLVGSLRSGRLAGHQLPGLRAKFEHAWLCVEGQWRADEQGLVVTYQGQARGWKPLLGKMRASEMEKHLLTLELCGGLHVRYTNSRADTVRFIANLFRWWSDQALDHHTSHLAVHDAPTLVPISEWRAAFTKLPGVGIRSSKAVADHFHNSLRLAARAPVSEWAGIAVVDESKATSRRLGEKVAQRIDRFLDGKK